MLFEKSDWVWKLRIYCSTKTTPHPTGARKLLTIDFLGFQWIDHSPYSPDLAPFDFAVFPCLKGDLRRNWHENLHDLRMAVRSKVASYEKEWYGHIYEQWVQRHWKCVRENGEYFEKM